MALQISAAASLSFTVSVGLPSGPMISSPFASESRRLTVLRLMPSLHTVPHAPAWYTSTGPVPPRRSLSGST